MAGGKAEIEVDATTVGQIFRHLRAQFPNIEEYMLNDIGVAIDGVMYQDAWLKKVSDENEVCLLPRIGGG